MSNLIEIINQSKRIEDLLVESNGELTPELEKELMIIDVQLPQKIDNYASVIDRMKLAGEYYKQKSDFYYKFSKSCDGVVKKLKENIKYALVNMGLEELLGSEIRFKLKNNKKSVFIKDEALIPEKYKYTEPVVKVDTALILADLEKGLDVPGAEILQSKSVMVYPNKK